MTHTYTVSFITNHSKKYVVVQSGYHTLEEAIEEAQNKWRTIMDYNKYVAIRIERKQAP